MSKYARKGLTLAVAIVTFKLDWREGGKHLLLNWEMDTALCRVEDELDGLKVTELVLKFTSQPET